MLTFQPFDLLLVAVAGLILIAGLTFLALRRRNEILQDFLTPEEPAIEEEFFKRRPVVEETVEPDEPAVAETGSEDGAAWGIPDESTPDD